MATVTLLLPPKSEERDRGYHRIDTFRLDQDAPRLLAEPAARQYPNILALPKKGRNRKQ